MQCCVLLCRNARKLVPKGCVRLQGRGEGRVGGVWQRVWGAGAARSRVWRGGGLGWSCGVAGTKCKVGARCSEPCTVAPAPLPCTTAPLVKTFFCSAKLPLLQFRPFLSFFCRGEQILFRIISYHHHFMCFLFHFCMKTEVLLKKKKSFGLPMPFDNSVLLQ